jgi:predicted phage-related endonuclease
MDVALKETQFKKDEISNQLKELLKDNDTGLIGERMITWKNVESERLDSTRLKLEDPSTYAKYTKLSNYRRFIVK